MITPRWKCVLWSLLFPGLTMIWSCDSGGAPQDKFNYGDDKTDADADADADTEVAADTDAEPGTDADADADTDRVAETCCPHDPNRPPDSSGLEGDFCYRNNQCRSGLCISYQQTTPDPGGYCDTPANPNMMVAIGTTLDFETRQPVAGASIRVDGVTLGSVQGCKSKGYATLESDENGHFRKTISMPGIAEQIGIVALAEENDVYANSTSGVADPPWPKAFIRRDILIVKKATLDKWSQWLAEDAEMANFLPLVAKGGVVGAVPNVDTGAGVVGAKLRSLNAKSKARIRYLNAEGTGFVADGVTESGIFVMVNPGLAEKFDVYMGDDKINITTATAGDIPCMIFVLDIPIEADEEGLWDKCDVCE